MASDRVERERTWLVRSLPDPLPAGTPIQQGYVVVDGEVAFRIRRAGPRHIATVKGRGGRSRIEVEWDITAEQFAGLWPLTGCLRLEKVRHEVPVGDRTAEVDVFGTGLDGLVLVEVEFDDEATMEAFTPPAWFGDEVSDDSRYGNAALARDGLPPDAPGR